MVVCVPVTVWPLLHHHLFFCWYVEPWCRINKTFLSKSRETSIWSKFNAIMDVLSIKSVLTSSVLLFYYIYNFLLMQLRANLKIHSPKFSGVGWKTNTWNKTLLFCPGYKWSFWFWFISSHLWGLFPLLL